MSRADTPDEVQRLRAFWEARYQGFSLSESGWSGAGDAFNRLVYRCKTAAARRALASCGHTAGSRFQVLDAGCGQGYFADFYARAFPHADYVGLDLSRRVISHLHATRPGIEAHEGDLSRWSPEPPRRFDVIQCLEVLHLILDDDVVQRAFENLAHLLMPGGALLVTVRPGEEEATPSHYLRHRAESRLRDWWQAAGLVERRRIPIYYWMPDGGPAWPAMRPVFFRLPAAAIYAADRLALRLRLPRVATGPDSKMALVVLGREGAAA